MLVPLLQCGRPRIPRRKRAAGQALGGSHLPFACVMRILVFRAAVLVLEAITVLPVLVQHLIVVRSSVCMEGTLGIYRSCRSEQRERKRKRVVVE